MNQTSKLDPHKRLTHRFSLALPRWLDRKIYYMAVNSRTASWHMREALAEYVEKYGPEGKVVPLTEKERTGRE